MQVPLASIVCMILSALISIGLPLGLFLYMRAKYAVRAAPFLVGMAAFLIFVLILEQRVHNYVFANYPLIEKPALFVIYGVLMAGVFEETARFCAFTLLKKRGGLGSVTVGVTYGIGHGGIESAMFVGITMINNIIASVMLNSGQRETLTASLEGAALEQANAGFASLASTTPALFFVGGLERVFTMGVQIGLSVLLFYAVSAGRTWLFPAAILLHALVDVPAAMMQAGILDSMFVVEALAGLCGAGLLLLARAVSRSPLARPRELPGTGRPPGGA